MDSEQPGGGVFTLINEYGREHVSRLYALMAISAPLTIWAPSGLFIEKELGGDSIPTLIAAMDAGHVRIMARDDWLSNGPSRRSRARHWEFATWHHLDNAIAARRDTGAVIRIADEHGRDHARAYLEEHPRTVARVNTLVESALSGMEPSLLPQGTLQRASEQVGERRAIEVIRDVYNHAEAYRISGAHLDGFDVQWGFFQQRLLSQIARGARATRLAPRQTSPHERRPPVFPAEAFARVLEVLQPRPSGEDIMEFLNSPAHQELVDWVHDEAAVLSSSADPDVLAGHLASDLIEGLSTREHPALRRLDEFLDVLGSATLATVVAPPVALALLTALGLGMGFVSVAKTAYRIGVSAGLVAPETAGPTWPFAYSHSKRRPSDIRRLRTTLLRIAELDR